MVTYDDIFEAYYDCRKHKRSTSNALAFEIDYESRLLALCDEINDRTYTIGRSIAFVVTRPKLREVFAADFRDRIVHHLVIRKLEPLFESVFIRDNYNCRIGKGVLFGVKRLSEQIQQVTENYTKDAYIFKGDIKGFFMHIDKTILWDRLEAFIKANYNEPDKEEILWLARMIVMHCPEKSCIRKGNLALWDDLPKDKSLFTSGDNFGLPIGNLSSQVLANFFLHDFDIWARDTFKGYGRYVDDFYIMDDKKVILSNIQKIQLKLAEVGLRLHPRKFFLQHYTKGVTFTGAVVKMNRAYIGNRCANNFRRAVASLNRYKDKQAHIAEFVQRANSYLGFLNQYLTYGIRREIYKTIDAQWWKYAYAAGAFNKVVLRHKYKSL